MQALRNRYNAINEYLTNYNNSIVQLTCYGQFSFLEQVKFGIESGRIKGQYKISPEEAKKIANSLARNSYFLYVVKMLYFSFLKQYFEYRKQKV